MLFLCSELCIAWCKTENEKQKAREKSRKWSSDHTHTQKKAVAVLPDCVFIPCYFPFSPLSLSFLSCYVTSVAGSVPLGVPAFVIQPARSFTPIAAEASLQTLLVITDCACTNVKVVPFPTAAPHSKKKKKARSTFKQKRDTNELALKKQFFFVFRKKVTNQLRLQFTFVFIVVTVLLLMMLYFSSSFLFKSLPTSALMLTARCTLIKRLTKKKKKRECARHSRNKNGGKKTKTHTTPAFLLCFFLASRSHSPSLPLTRTHMQETPHTLLDFTLSFFFFCVYSPLKARQQGEREPEKWEVHQGRLSKLRLLVAAQRQREKKREKRGRKNKTH